MGVVLLDLSPQARGIAGLTLVNSGAPAGVWA